jgi:hypothetical protein
MTITGISITAKGRILVAMTGSEELDWADEVALAKSEADYNEAKALLNEFAEVMGDGIFEALLEVRSAEESAQLIREWKKEQTV